MKSAANIVDLFSLIPFGNGCRTQQGLPKLIIIRIALLIAGLLLLAETALGGVYVLGIGFSSLTAIAAYLCLILAFPIYLMGGISLRWASCGLWLLFVLQFVELSLIAEPEDFVNPFGWAQGIFFLAEPFW